MATTTLGTKYTCFSCQAKFYDLNRPEPVCPKCGSNQRDQPKQPKAGGGRSRAADRVREEVYVPPAPEVEEEEAEVAPADLDASAGDAEADEESDQDDED